jgi:hypothetical protein
VVFYDITGALQVGFGFPVAPGQLLYLLDVNRYSDLAAGGRIEVFSTGGARLSSWLASSDRVTGDPDAQPPTVILP